VKSLYKRSVYIGEVNCKTAPDNSRDIQVSGILFKVSRNQNSKIEQNKEHLISVGN